MQFHILTMTAFNVDAVATLHANTFKSIGENKTKFKSFLQNSQNITTLIASDQNNNPIGYMTLNIRTGYLSWMNVSPHYQRQGVARALMQHALSEAQKAGLSSITLDTRNQFKPAIHFYLKVGFNIVGCFINEQGELLIRMALQLKCQSGKSFQKK